VNRRNFFGGLAAGSLVACAGCRPAPPIRTVEYPSPRKQDPDRLVVMLPGFGDQPDAYDDHGFVGLLPRAGVDADVVAVHAHLGHYVDRDLLPRLRDGVIEPARDRGVQAIWLVGASMGGLGALLAAREFEDRIQGAVLLSPHLGSRKITREIAAAGGPKTWTPPQTPSKDYTVELWRWLRGYAEDGATRPRLYLGYGTKEDRAPFDLLAGLLPPDRVVAVEGGRHGWPTWEKAFPVLVSRRAFTV
jgi:pimeloyl-ACP methyl ester carboxylesterase